MRIFMDVVVLEVEATVTGRGQITVPAEIRKMLSLGKNARVVFRGLPDGTVTIQKKDEDAALGSFLSFLEADLKTRPQTICPITKEFMRDAMALVEGVEVDFDAALPADVPE
jgi:antitoxin PrlF